MRLYIKANLSCIACTSRHALPATLPAVPPAATPPTVPLATQFAALPALPPRPRPLPGAMVDVGICAPHTRRRGRLHWTRYTNEMPPAITVVNGDGSATKVFEWKMLLKNVDGRMKLVKSKEGKTVRTHEPFIEVCDVIRSKWLLRTYGINYLYRPERGFSILEDRRPRLLDTWHTRKTLSLVP